MPKQRVSKQTTGVTDGWHPIVGLMFYKHKRGYRMNVGLTRDVDGKWLVVAIEGPAGAQGVQGVLDNHAHKYLGRFTLSKGIAAAEKYAREWKPGKEVPCACDDIEVPAPRRKGAKAVA